MHEESPPPVEGNASGGSEGTVRGILQNAIQKIMDEIGQHEEAARRHLQMAEALRKELQEGFKLARHEARSKMPAADGTDEPAATDPAVPQQARAGARKRLGGRKMRGKK